MSLASAVTALQRAQLAASAGELEEARIWTDIGTGWATLVAASAAPGPGGRQMQRELNDLLGAMPPLPPVPPGAPTSET